MYNNTVNNLKLIFKLILFTLTPTFLIWIPFAMRLESFWNIPLPTSGMATIIQNYDGPHYIVVAKTFYNLEQIASQFSFPLPLEYYAAHFPLFPALVRLFSFQPLGYIYSMLFVTVSTSLLTLYFFHKFISQYTNKENALWLTFVFAIFPARWLIVRSVGSPEPLFIASLIAAVYYFQNQKYLKSGIWGMVAQLTKSPGIILFAALLLSFLYTQFKKIATKPFSKWLGLINWKALPILLIPLSLLGLFVFYKYKFGDFFAYFNSGDNIHLFFPPFQIFNYSAPWVGTFWLEEVIFIYIIGAIGFVKLFNERQTTLYLFTGLFFLSTLFVSHRDLLRYSLPLVPFLVTAFRKTLIKREFKIAIAVVLIPIYLYSLVFISQNTMPISDWAPFL